MEGHDQSTQEKKIKVGHKGSLKGIHRHSPSMGGWKVSESNSISVKETKK